VGERHVAPSIAGPTVGGGRLDLGSFAGQVVVLNFWGSWCAPCRDEASGLEGAYQATRGQGVQFVGIDERDSDSQAGIFLRSLRIGYPSLSDRTGELLVRFRDLPPTAIPSTLVLDRRGRIAARVIGETTYSELVPVVRSLAAERA
jgi:thiol-disulfide isomerase/thioredoxin